jgi:hypothetical protein
MARKQSRAPTKAANRAARDIVQVEKAAEEITEKLALEGIIPQDKIEKTSPRVAEIILKIQHQSAIVRGYFVSPFAPHSEQAEYEKLCPGVTDRQMKVFEDRMSTRNWCDKVRVLCVPVGMALAFVIVLYGMYKGISLIMTDKPLNGLALMFAPLAGLGGVFIIGKKMMPDIDKDEWN